MGWPKGKSRKGYIRKDGQPHMKRGENYTGKVKIKADPAVTAKGHGVLVGAIWGAKGSGAISSPCPNCHYAYADGGYCQECGWMRPVKVDPYGTHAGRRF